MDRQPSKIAHVLVLAMLRARAALANAWQAAAIEPAEKYRPEAHYMRGRGPKWHEKNARIPVR